MKKPDLAYLIKLTLLFNSKMRKCQAYYLLQEDADEPDDGTMKPDPENTTPNWPLDRNSYLIRFLPNTEHPLLTNDFRLLESVTCGGPAQNPLLVMGDLGLTWEPSRNCSTKQVGELAGDDLEADVAKLEELSNWPDDHDYLT